MLSKIYSLTLVIAALLLSPPAIKADLIEKLKSIQGVLDVRPIEAPAGTRQGNYEVIIEQPLDHWDPAAGTFRQRFYVSHVDYGKPVLLHTEGNGLLNVEDYGDELAHMLNGPNQIAVEHRYFGHSVPTAANGAIPWKYLTVKNAAADMHAIVSSLKKIYTGKWIATGRSKGGQAVLFYKCYYPDDVNATVAYVAPILIAQEDPRLNEFLNTVGDESTRKKITEFQIALLKKEDEILPFVKAEAERNKWTFSIGFAKAYEYGVLEYAKDFWMYGLSPGEIPSADASAEALAAHYNYIHSIQPYSDQGKKHQEAFLYQALTETGFFNFDITHFKRYLKANPNPTNLDICPDGTKDKIVYNSATMIFVHNFLRYQANNVVYVYGSNDMCSGAQVQLLGRTNAVKILIQGTAHNATINKASTEQKEEFYTNMEKWLNIKLIR